MTNQLTCSFLRYTEGSFRTMTGTYKLARQLGIAGCFSDIGVTEAHGINWREIMQLGM